MEKENPPPKPQEGWLVLSRKEWQSFLIGKDIEISISKIKRSEVLIAIKAPGYKILRKEVKDVSA
jgi:carbon storage regulator CsrA